MKGFLLLISLVLSSCNTLTDNQLTVINKNLKSRGYNNIIYVGDGIARKLCNMEYDRHLLMTAEHNNKVNDLVVCYAYVNNKIQVHKVDSITKYQINTVEGVHE